MRRRNASTGKELHSTMEGITDMRVKLEYQGERRILPVARPVMIEQLQAKIVTTFGDGLSINYENGEVFIQITKQSDLDKAIALLDQSPHLTSLRLTLSRKCVTPFDNTKKHNDSKFINGTVNEFLPDHELSREEIYFRSSPIRRASPDELFFNDSPDNCFCNGRDVTRPVPIRSHSNPEEMYNTSSDDELISPIRVKSMHTTSSSQHIHNNRYGESPPPGHLPEDQGLLHNHHPEVQNGGGVFIPEDNNDIRSFNHHDYRPDERQKLKESYDSLLGSSSPPLSTSHMSIASEDNSLLYRQPSSRRGERRRPLSDLMPDTITLFEYDSDGNTSLKSEFYDLKSKPRPRSEWNLAVDSSGDNGGTFSWMNSYRESFIPVHRTNSSSSIGQSSNSSGLVPDYEHRCERELADRVQKIKVNNNNNNNNNINISNAEISFKYRTVRQLGAGAFGTVYLCVDLDTGKEMAMKCVETGVFNPATIKEVEILKGEIQLYRTIKHDRVVNYYGTMQDSKSISIFMEYMAGGSIHEKISKVGALSEEEVSKYCRQILEGIAYLHNKNIIHRDIKGANILLDECDNCKLADFGASRQIQTIRSKTGCKSVHGTPYWMSPEVINGEGYGRKADIWSLGCTALEMLTTKPPWFQYEPMAALFKIATQPTDPNLASSTSPSCRQFVEICFNREPSMRPTAADLLHYQFVKKVECY